MRRPNQAIAPAVVAVALPVPGFGSAGTLPGQVPHQSPCGTERWIVAQLLPERLS